MNFKSTTWILIAALAAVGGYFFFVDQKNRAREVEERKLGARLFPYPADEFAGFVLVNPKGERIEVVRDESDADLAHAAGVEEILAGVDVMLHAGDYALLRPLRADLVAEGEGGAWQGAKRWHIPGAPPARCA